MSKFWSQVDAERGQNVSRGHRILIPQLQQVVLENYALFRAEVDMRQNSLAQEWRDAIGGLPAWDATPVEGPVSLFMPTV